jgi:hypothetical protein
VIDFFETNKINQCYLINVEHHFYTKKIHMSFSWQGSQIVGVVILMILLVLETLDSNKVNFHVTITNWKKIKLHMIYIYGSFNHVNINKIAHELYLWFF